MWRAILAVIGVYLCLPALAQETISGPVTIYNTTYEHVDPGPPFAEAPRIEEDWQPPAPTGVERSAGFIPFTRPEPFDIKPWSKPRPTERVQELTCRAALGETTAFWFAVYALEPLNKVEVVSESNELSVNLEVRYVHYWAQRTNWRGRTYYITPELLLEMRDGQARFPAKGGTLEWRPLNIPQGESRLFWIRVKVAPDAKPGEYQRKLTIKAQGKAPLSLNVRVHVYPFRLQKPPDKRWLLYSDSWRLSNLPDEKLVALLRHLREWGIDGLIELPFGNLDVSAIAEGRVAYDPQPLLRWHRLMQQAGLPGPHVIVTFIEDEVARRLGSGADPNREWSEPLRNAMLLVARTVVDTLKSHSFDWLYYGIDEPGPDNIRALWQYRTWREAGAQTYVTFYVRETYEVAGQWMTHPCFSVGLVANQQLAQWALEQCRVRGQKFYWYGSGCYLGQEGRMFPNRFLAGWLFWKTMADGQVSWTFVRPHEDPFNDFDGSKANPYEPKDQCTAYPELATPNDWRSIQGIIPTIQWEALREGITDYLYLATMRNTIAYARSVAVKAKGTRWSTELMKTADECEQTLKAVEESVPWLSEVGRANFTNANLQEIRVTIGQSLEKLVRLLKGERLAAIQRPRTLTMRVRMVPPIFHPIPESYLPLLNLPRWSQPPTIDGKLDEPQWQTSAVAAPFYESQSSVPIPDHLQTRAMVAFDENALYIGFDCRAPHPDRLVVNCRERDADGIWLDEGVEIFLSAPEKPNHYAHFIFNAGGFVYDELGFDKSWDAQFTVATAVNPKGWTAEIAIPWVSLPFATNLDEGGKPFLRLNLCRNHRERGSTGPSHWAWSPTFGWFHNPTRFGFAMIAPDDIVVTQVDLPSYLDDLPVRVSLANLGEQEREVKVNAQRVVIPAKKQKTVLIPSSTEPGKHSYTVEVRWQGGRLQVPVVYSIPAPLQVVRRAVLATGGKVEIPIALALRKPERYSLQVQATNAQPTKASVAAGKDFSLRLSNIQGSKVKLQFALPGHRTQTPGVLIFIAPQ